MEGVVSEGGGRGKKEGKRRYPCHAARFSVCLFSKYSTPRQGHGREARVAELVRRGCADGGLEYVDGMV